MAYCYEDRALFLVKGMKRVRKLAKALAVFLLIYLVLFGCAGPSKAADVWVDHWASENVDLYVMDDILASGTDSQGPWFAVAVKRVQNGKLDKVVTWRFFKADTVWQYYTSTMAGSRRTGVLVPNKIFEYGMKQLGWSYSSDGTHYY